VISPVWHGIDQHYLAEVGPMPAGRLGVSTTNGIPYVAEELIRALARELQAKIDPRRREPIVRSLEPAHGELRQNGIEASTKALPVSDSARTRLTRFVGMYAGTASTPDRRSSALTIFALRARNPHANPDLMSEVSEYVQPIERPDQPTIAGAPRDYYGAAGGHGNQVSGDQLASMLNGNRVGA
jgi:hypothetical protein